MLSLQTGEELLGALELEGEGGLGRPAGVGGVVVCACFPFLSCVSCIALDVFLCLGGGKEEAHGGQWCFRGFMTN